MRAKIIGSTVAGAALLLPLVANAQNVGQGLFGTFNLFNRLLNSVMALCVLVAVIAVFYGVIRYLFSKDNREAAHKGMIMAIYGIIAIAIMVSIWGIINILQSTFGINSRQQAVTPSGIYAPL